MGLLKEGTGLIVKWKEDGSNVYTYNTELADFIDYDKVPMTFGLHFYYDSDVKNYFDELEEYVETYKLIKVLDKEPNEVNNY